MASIKTADDARERARARWDGAAGVDRRVDGLAETIRRKIDALPPLTESQRAKLAALLRPADRPGA